MLSNKLRRAGAIFSAAAILCTSASLTAAAKTPVQVPEQQTISVINENFDRHAAGTSVNMPKDSQVQLVENVLCGKHGTSTTAAAIETREGTNNALSLNVNDGLDLDFTGSSIPVELGDVITVQFDYYFDSLDTSHQYNLAVNLNNSRGNYVHKKLANYGDEWGPADCKAAENQGRILNFYRGGSKPVLTESDSGWYNAISSSFDGWHTVTVTIDTQDEALEGKQSLKVEQDGSYFKGLYDASYTGDGDTTYDPFTSINSLQFDIYDPTYGDKYVKLDNVSVSVTGERYKTTYVSDLNRVLVNEDFSNLTGTINTPGWPSAITDLGDLAGTEFHLYSASSPATIQAAADPTDAANMAYKYNSGFDGHASTLYTKFDPVTVDEGDVINISLDYYQVNEGTLGILLKGVTSTAAAFKTGYQTQGYGLNQGTSVGGDWYSGIKMSFNNDEIPLARNGHGSTKAFVPMTGHNGGNAYVQTFGTGTWYTIEISIDTKNDEFGGKQTLTMNYKNRSTGEYIQKFTGYFDADSSTVSGLDQIDRLTVFNGFGIAMISGVQGNYDKIAAYLDNVKCSITKSGFDGLGEATDDFATEKKFTAGKQMNVAAAADPTMFKTVTRNEKNEITDITDKRVPMMLAAALYDGDGRFIGAKVAEKTLSASDTYIETESFDTTGVAKVRTFLWEKNNIAPYLNFGEFTADSSN